MHQKTDVNQLLHAPDSCYVPFELIENDFFSDESCQILHSGACSQDNLAGKEYETDS